MDIVALESFVTVYNYKNFTKAADKLYISQPALSRRMKALEEELGITLFKRRGTSIEGITEGGKFFYKEAVKLLKQADELRLKVNRCLWNVADCGITGFFPFRGTESDPKDEYRMALYRDYSRMLYGHKKSGLTAISDRSIGGYSDYIPGRGGGYPRNQL